MLKYPFLGLGGLDFWKEFFPLSSGAGIRLLLYAIRNGNMNIFKKIVETYGYLFDESLDMLCLK